MLFDIFVYLTFFKKNHYFSIFFNSTLAFRCWFLIVFKVNLDGFLSFWIQDDSYA